MADILVYNKKHWNNTYIKGDIVEVRPDGFYEKNGFDKEAFMLIQIDTPYKDIEHYNRPVYSDDYSELIHAKRYNVDINNLDANEKVFKIETMKTTDKVKIGKEEISSNKVGQ
jgi:hypothetical protein